MFVCLSYTIWNFQQKPKKINLHCANWFSFYLIFRWNEYMSRIKSIQFAWYYKTNTLTISSDWDYVIFPFQNYYIYMRSVSYKPYFHLAKYFVKKICRCHLKLKTNCFNFEWISLERSSYTIKIRVFFSIKASFIIPQIANGNSSILGALTRRKEKTYKRIN